MDAALNEDFHWLLSTEAEPLLIETQASFAENVNAVRIARNLRKRTTPSRSAIVMEQAQLRIRGTRKFDRAERMFFTRRGLEQATSQRLAAYKAGKFAGISGVIDLCCGIGGDLIGLAQRSLAQHTAGVDFDPLTCLFARRNLAEHLPGGSADPGLALIEADVESLDWGRWQGIHCDPDRRMNDRTVVESRFSPPLSHIFSRLQPEQNIAIKIAPATVAAHAWPENLDREWLGDRRECKQQILWLGPRFETAGQRIATMVDGDQVVQLAAAKHEIQITVNISRNIGRYLYEPHPTVLAADLTNVLADRGGLWRIDPEIDYLTSELPMKSPLITRFEVLEAFPLNSRKALDFLKHHQIGQIELKNRGAAQVTYQQFLRFKLNGPYRATVILTRIGLQQWVAICRRNPDDFPF